MGVNRAYSQAYGTGLYGKPTGLRGKYDNVRRFWEDEVTRLHIGRHLPETDKIRVMDLGCGSGDGYELLTGMTDPGADPARCSNRLLPPEKIELYTGIEINPDLLAQGEGIYRKNGRVCFRRGDFSGGLPVEEGEPPYHLYLTTYGTLSHCHDAEAARMFADIARHGGGGAVIVADWLGGYSYEWQDLWQKELPADHCMDYVVSYLLEEEDRAAGGLESFPLRLMDKKTVLALVDRAEREAGRPIRVLEIFDRSVFVGRHMETADYHRRPQALRRAVNSLWEPGRRTDLRELRVEYLPREGFDRANRYFTNAARAWNALVNYTDQLLSGPGSRPGPLPADTPAALRQAAETMRALVAATSTLPLEDPRANIIEPQLAYLLRSLETAIQDGRGMAHGIVAVLQVAD